MHQRSVFSDQSRGPVWPRLAVVAGTLLAGLLACAALLAALGGPVTSALAAPAAGPVVYPGGAGCTTTLQACIDNSPIGTTIVITPNTYITNALTLNKAVSLTGVSSATVILHAMVNQRVLTVTGAAVDSSVIISGLTLAAGHAVGGSCPAGCGGAILITGTAQPLLINLIITNSAADTRGGGVYAHLGSPLALSGVAVLNNASSGSGGGVAVSATLTLTGGLFQNNQCVAALCAGGGLATSSNLVATGTVFTNNASAALGGGAFASGNMSLNGGLFQNNHCNLAGCQGGGLATNSHLSVTGTGFVSNTSVSNGGGAYAISHVTLSGATFQNNRCFASPCFGGGLANHGDLTATSTSFVSNTSTVLGGGVYGGGMVNLFGGAFQNNQCTDPDCGGGGLYSNFSTIATGTQFLTNTSTGGGGAINAGLDVMVTGGVFRANQCTTSDCSGGAVTVQNSLHLTSTQFLSNTSGSAGGGAESEGDALVTGGLFQGNRCTGSTCGGGGLSVGGSLSLSGTRFLNNQCTTSDCRGGAVFVQTSLNLTDTQFLSNTSSGSVGGAVRSDGPAWVTGGLFQGNRCLGSACSGGGLAVDSSLSLSGASFLNNQCTGAGCVGGGLFVSGELNLSAAQFLSNTTNGNGGGLYAGGQMAVTNTLFLSNTAQQGAGLYHASLDGRLVNNLFAANQASSHGDALALASPGAVTLLHTTLVGPAFGSGALVYVTSGTVVLTNTLIASDAVGIQNVSGTVHEDYSLFSSVNTHFSGTVGGHLHSLTGAAGFKNPAAGASGYHLGFGSAAIDAGIDAGILVDIDGDPRPLGNGIDIGFDEAAVRRVFLALLRR